MLVSEFYCVVGMLSISQVLSVSDTLTVGCSLSVLHVELPKTSGDLLLDTNDLKN